MKKIVAILTMIILSATINAQNQKNHFLDLDDIIEMKVSQDTAKLISLGFVNIDNVWSNDSTGEYITFYKERMELSHIGKMIRKSENRSINVDGILIRQIKRCKNHFDEPTDVEGLGEAYIKYAQKKDQQLAMYVNWKTKRHILQIYNKDE
jgi:hypothetical protein